MGLSCLTVPPPPCQVFGFRDSGFKFRVSCVLVLDFVLRVSCDVFRAPGFEFQSSGQDSGTRNGVGVRAPRIQVPVVVDDKARNPLWTITIQLSSEMKSLADDRWRS